MVERNEWRPEDRLLYLNGEITDEQCGEITGRLIEHWEREFLLIINSDGGSSFNALGIVNLMRQHGRVDTLCIGVALSGAADCLAAGRKRYIVPAAVAMLHQVSWELGREFAGNLVKNAQFLERLNGAMADQLVELTGRTRAELDRDMATDFYLFGQEIIDYGVADAFWNPEELLPRHAPLKRGRIRAAAAEGRKSMAPKPEPDKR